MVLSQLNPHIRYARLHHAHLEDKKELSVCYDCRLFFVENADGYVVANGIKYKISNGTAIYFPPQTRYYFRILQDKNFKMIIIDFDLVSDYAYLKSSLGTATEKNFLQEKVPKYSIHELLSEPIVKMFPQVHASLIQCTENFLHKHCFYRENSSALLKLCLLELIHNNSAKSTYSKLCEKVLNYIYENYALQELTNNSIAENFNYHPYHLNHIIKSETGKSLHKHLVETRINVAKNYLLTTAYNVEHISWKCGFSSTSYFIKCFKEIIGVTPKKYRQIRFHTEL